MPRIKKSSTTTTSKPSGKSSAPANPTAQTHAYDHRATQAVQRPEVGLQQEFLKERRPPRVYRFDSSLDPQLSWDENRERELAEWLLGLIARVADEGEEAVFGPENEKKEQVWAGGSVRVASLKGAVRILQQLSQPFLNWAGKAERHDLEVPTVPLFVHERHATKAIIEGLANHRAKGINLDLFGDAGLDLTDKLRAYEHLGPWVNRLILGDSLLVMNSLLEYEGLGGQVQMIYLDPPYGVKFGSNFQPFVRKRDVKHGADEHMTREPEMVKAYRDTWELGLHSYLTYLRDRLWLAKELLTPSGSIFVQISDENLHHVRAVMDEVFGAQNFYAVIAFSKTSSASTEQLASTMDFLVWYAKDATLVKYRQLYLSKQLGISGTSGYLFVQLPDGSRRRMSTDEIANPEILPLGSRPYTPDNLTSQRPAQGGDLREFQFQGRTFTPGKGTFKTDEVGLRGLEKANRLEVAGSTLRYVRFLDDFPVFPINNAWTDTGVAGFTADKLYVVQTNTKVIERCLLMTTDPGDLVFDPTCGSGTTAYVAEQWGRRWITCDASRVPLALARQRLLTATYPYYQLKDPAQGPQGGFVYQRKQNRKGEEIGGLVPHITLKSITNNEPPRLEVLVDRPEQVSGVTRVTGPFTVEATLPAAMDLEAEAEPATGTAQPQPAYHDIGNHLDRMVQVLRQSKTLQLPGNRTLSFESVQALADADVLHAEAVERSPLTPAPLPEGEGIKVDVLPEGEGIRVAVVFGPEDGAIGSETVYHAAEEAKDRGYAKLYFFGFAIQAKAREMLEDRSRKKLPCAYVAVTPDVVMSDLLKTTRASQIFSITGLPDVDILPTGQRNLDGQPLWRVRVKGLDTFNPATLETESVEAQNLPCWMLDTDYDGLCFYANQVFFPKTSAWEDLKKSLGATFDESVWAHLAGVESEPFAVGEKRRVAVKVIDERGNELMVVREVKP